ncbi:platelet endothelial cell adhesion molecule isoform X1 [Girardinichthys multiradiatus]|uniref:platelet endothelial cell adhesion molecule isoform X1 n=1 Tax=Girardinichthys multiradiatus TaxID=208333 RepID=UPI001FAC781F|nr:platelet endothelial cell adhesion molecule isoform X1 [Girardinichthys multiradiatus]
MGLRLLLTSTLLLSWTASNSALKITSVNLSIEPNANVIRNTSVTLRCKAGVLAYGTEAPNRVYTIYKDDNVIYNKTTSSSEDFFYNLPEARVSNNGKYRCMTNIMGEKKASEVVTLTVTGMSTPILRLNKANITEGEVVTATCLAPGETGSLLFSFYDGSKEVDKIGLNSNSVGFRPKGVGDHIIHCSYSVFIMPNVFKSQRSNVVTVKVKELSLEPILKISPQNIVYEGDTLNITCSVSDYRADYRDAELLLSQGNKILQRGNTSIHVSWTACATSLKLTIECWLYVGNVAKVDNKTVPVIELFSVPTLKMSPPEVFQGDSIRLICQSERLSYNRLGGENLIYSLEPLEYHMSRAGNGVFAGNAKTIDSNYTCTAAAKGIKKKSNVLTIRPKVSLSAPKIWVSGTAILGRKIEIFCLSNTGTPPITYTLWKTNEQKQIAIVQELSKPANFTVYISQPEELIKYFCSANNGGKKPYSSDKLHAAVIEPMTEAHLMVLPISGDISEGNSVTLICSFKGTPPVTVRWFRDGDPNALETTTTKINTTNYPFILSKEHSDKYYCKAENRANSVESNRVNLVVGMAMWKKLLIPGIVILVVPSLVLVGFVLFIRSRRVRVDRTPESVWSSRKPETETDDEISTLSNEPEVEYTEVVHSHSADPSRSPLRKGTDTVYSELQNSPHGAADHHDYGSVKYVDLSGDQQPGSLNNYSDLPMPVD